MLGRVGSFAARLVLLATLEAGLSSCIPSPQYAADTIKRASTVKAARETFLLKSSRIFYPDGIPPDPSILPKLTDAQLHAVEQLLEEVVRRVRLTLHRHTALLAGAFPAMDITREAVQLKVLNEGQPVAVTEASGRINVDAKVVQAAYRSALLAVFMDNTAGGHPLFDAINDIQSETPAPTAAVSDHGNQSERERVAFSKFAQFAAKLGAMSSFLPASDVRAFAKSADSAEMSDSKVWSTAITGVFGVLNARLDEMALMDRSRTLESVFLGAVEFLAAHEMAHLVLRHFPLAALCADACERELEADRYAVLVNLLAEFDDAPRITFDRFRPGFQSTSDAGTLGLMFTSQQHYKRFFQHAYSLAQFDSNVLSVAECMIPPQGEREEKARPYAEVVEHVIYSARYADAVRRSSRKTARELYGPSPFAVVYGSMCDDAVHNRREPTFDYLDLHRTLLHDLFYAYYAPASEKRSVGGL